MISFSPPFICYALEIEALVALSRIGAVSDQNRIAINSGINASLNSWVIHSWDIDCGAECIVEV